MIRTILPSDAPTVALQILDETADGVLLTDQLHPDNPIIYANAAFARMTSYSLAETLGRNCRFLQGSDWEQPEIAIMRNAIAQSQAVTVTLRNYRQDGSMFWNEVRLAPLRDPDRPDIRPRYYVGFQRDVSDRISAGMKLRRALHAAEEADAAKVHFLKAMGHEFRTAISVIVGFSDLLIAAAERGTSDAQHLAHLGDIRGSAHHLLMMVEDARQYLSVSSAADLKRERVLLSRVVEGAAQHAEPVLRDLGAKLHVVASGQVEVEADILMLRQALANLIAELARRATRDSNLSVELSSNEEQAVIEVRCLTLVLPTAIIFTSGRPFEDGNILHRGLEGSGVSLVVAGRIIRYHGGELGVRSETHLGTAIRVTLPLLAAVR